MKEIWYLWLIIIVILGFKIIRKIIYIYKIRRAGLFQIDKMSGKDFEVFVEQLFRKKGYKVNRIGKSGDYGADLIVEKDKKTVIQAKRWKGNVSIKSVQEVIGAMGYYEADSAMVITNSFFTKNAKALAKRNKVKLINRIELADLINTTR